MGLDDAFNGTLSTSQASFVGPIVNAMLVLITSFAVDGVSVGAVAQCGSFLFNGIAQDANGFAVNAFPSRFVEVAATGGRMNFSRVENFCRVKVADSADNALV